MPAYLIKSVQNTPAVNASCKGFTLLELIIAVSLTAILMTVLVTGINIIAKDWEKQGKNLDTEIDHSLLLLQLEKAMVGTFPYRYKERKLDKEKIYFSGKPDEVRWVSTVSGTRQNTLTIWSLKIQDEGGIVINTKPAYPGSINEEQPNDKLAEPNTYLKNFKIKIAYLGNNKKLEKTWYKNWDMEQKNSLPSAIRLSIQPHNENQQYELFAAIRVSSNGMISGSSPFGTLNQRGGLLGR